MACKAFHPLLNKSKERKTLPGESGGENKVGNVDEYRITK